MKAVKLERVEPIAVRAPEAARMLGIILRMLRALTPTLPHVRVGTVVLFPVEALKTWANEQARKGRRNVR
jgi:hypothetical protein